MLHKCISVFDVLLNGLTSKKQTCMTLFILVNKIDLFFFSFLKNVYLLIKYTKDFY